MCLLQETCRNISTTINRNITFDLKGSSPLLSGSSQSPALCSAAGRTQVCSTWDCPAPAPSVTASTAPPEQGNTNPLPPPTFWTSMKQKQKAKTPQGKAACWFASYTELFLQHQPVPYKLLLYLAVQNVFFFSERLERLIGMMTGFHNMRFWRLVLNLTL